MGVLDCSFLWKWSSLAVASRAKCSSISILRATNVARASCFGLVLAFRRHGGVTVVRFRSHKNASFGVLIKRKKQKTKDLPFNSKELSDLSGARL